MKEREGREGEGGRGRERERERWNLSTLHDHCIFIVPAVPTEPLNFTLETIPGSPTQLLARWSPPSPTNGMITNYTVRCTSDTLPPSSVLTNTTVLTEVIGNDFSLTLSNLTPFTNYSCNVSASTVAGQGLPSVADTAQTDESGVQYYNYVCIATYILTLGGRAKAEAVSI